MSLTPQKQLLILRFLATRWWNEVGDLISANTDEHFAFDDLDFDLDLKELRRVASVEDLAEFVRIAVNNEVDEDAVAELSDFGEQADVDAFAELFAVNLVAVLAQPDLVVDYLPVLWDTRYDECRNDIVTFLARNIGTETLLSLAEEHLASEQLEQLQAASQKVHFLKSDSVMLHFEGERDRLERSLAQAFRKFGYTGAHDPDKSQLEYLTIKRVGAWVSVMLPPYFLDDSMQQMAADLYGRLSDTKALGRILVVWNDGDWQIEDWRNGRLYDDKKRCHWQKKTGAKSIVDFLQQQRVKLYDAGHPRALNNLDYRSTASNATKNGAIRKFCLIKQ